MLLRDRLRMRRCRPEPLFCCCCCLLRCDLVIVRDLGLLGNLRFGTRATVCSLDTCRYVNVHVCHGAWADDRPGFLFRKREIYCLPAVGTFLIIFTLRITQLLHQIALTPEFRLTSEYTLLLHYHPVCHGATHSQLRRETSICFL